MKGKKNSLFIVGFLLALVVCYRFAIANTLALRSEYKALQSESILISDIPQQLSVLKQKQRFYDSILGTSSKNTERTENQLLDILNKQSQTHSVKIVRFNEPHLFTESDIQSNTYNFILEGNYNSLVKVLYQIEQTPNLGELLNVQFIKKKNYKTGRYYLQGEVWLRRVEVVL